MLGTATAMDTRDYPESATAGQCFARVVMPPRVETVTSQIEVAPASSREVVIPAVYETRDIQVLIKEAITTYRTIPATYKTVTEQVMVQPERDILVQIPAQYETWTETIEVEPAKAVWKPGSGLYGRTELNDAAGATEIATGDVLCRVIESAKTVTVERSRMISPPRTETRTMPAVYRTVTKQVVDQPARLETVTVPAEYMTIPVDVMIEPARVETQIIPATYRTVEQAVVTEPSQLVWTEVLCDTNADSQKIADVQAGLVEAGYPIAVDGIFGPETLHAMEQFQRAQNLAVGYMTVETVQALNVSPYTAFAEASDAQTASLDKTIRPRTTSVRSFDSGLRGQTLWITGFPPH
ncbi:MAG: peptidoglycan-binding domain-containing protein [Henriciella sp.]|nr:peptidoglycan-binding domain-containing protein [Henriciella sp.]